MSHDSQMDQTTKAGVQHRCSWFIYHQAMLSALSVNQMDQLHVNVNQRGLLQKNGFINSLLPFPSDIMGSYSPFVPQLSTQEPSTNSSYLAWLQGVHSTLMAMTCSAQFTQNHHHSSESNSYPLTPSTDLSHLSDYKHMENVTNSYLNPVSSPVSRSTPMHDSNSTEDLDQPLALVVRKYNDTDRLHSTPLQLNSRRDSSPTDKSFSSNASTTSSSRISSTDGGTSTDTAHNRPSCTNRRLKSKPTNRHCSQVRRYKANARERSRVHTISAAFEALRQIVPTCPTTPKLSKLSVLRIASGYIEALRTCLQEDPQPTTEESELSRNDVIL